MCVILPGEWQTVYFQIRRRVLRHLIWVYTVCSGLSGRISTVSVVILSDQTPSELESSWIRPWVYAHMRTTKFQISRRLCRLVCSFAVRLFSELSVYSWKISLHSMICQHSMICHAGTMQGRRLA